jgi:hypothetical protein
MHTLQAHGIQTLTLTYIDISPLQARQTAETWSSLPPSAGAAGEETRARNQNRLWAQSAHYSCSLTGFVSTHAQLVAEAATRKPATAPRSSLLFAAMMLSGRKLQDKHQPAGQWLDSALLSAL